MKATHVRAARITVAVVLIALLAALGNRCAAETDKVFCAGAFAIDITPTEFPVLINGHFGSREATKIVDLLHARCLVLDDGSERIAMVVVDSCMLPRDLLDEAKRLASAVTRSAATASPFLRHIRTPLRQRWGALEPTPTFVTQRRCRRKSPKAFNWQRVNWPPLESAGPLRNQTRTSSVAGF